MSWSLILLLGLIALVTGVLVRRALRADAAQGTRGVEPGEGDQLVDGGYMAGGPGGGHSSITRVTRDPQKYAKAFVPGARKKRK
ncbi:MAG: hypothetical protein WCD16_01610 [Paracoccaceae bacterium]